MLHWLGTETYGDLLGREKAQAAGDVKTSRGVYFSPSSHIHPDPYIDMCEPRLSLEAILNVSFFLS